MAEEELKESLSLQIEPKPKQANFASGISMGSLTKLGLINIWKKKFRIKLSEFLNSLTMSAMVHTDFFDKLYLFSNNMQAKFMENVYHDKFPIPPSYENVIQKVGNMSYYKLLGGLKDEEIVYTTGVSSLGMGEILLPKSYLLNRAREMFPISATESTKKITDEQLMQFMLTKPIIEDVKISNSRMEQQDLTVVGYYDTEMPVSGLIFSDEQMKQLNLYAGISGFSTTVLNDRALDSAMFEELLKDDYRLNSVCSHDLERAKSYDDSGTFVKFGLFASLTFGVFSVIMMANFIITSINSNKKQIGVLRGLGMRASGVQYIFFFESAMIALASFVIASTFIVPMGMLLTSIALMKYAISIDVIAIGAVEIFSMLAIGLTITTLSSAIPIYRKTKISPVNLIKD